jgi:hypothetical protein
MAEPTPALAAGTALMTATVAGATTLPMASGPTKKKTATSHVGVFGCQRVTLAITRATVVSAANSCFGVPSLSVILWLSPEPMTRPNASGSITRPVSIADLPWTTCRYWVVRKISQNSAKNADEIASDPSENAGRLTVADRAVARGYAVGGARTARRA